MSPDSVSIPRESRSLSCRPSAKYGLVDDLVNDARRVVGQIHLSILVFPESADRFSGLQQDLRGPSALRIGQRAP